MAQIMFNVDTDALAQPRSILLRTNQNSRRPEYDIPQEPVYKPINTFIQDQNSLYTFRLINLLHVAAVKMLGWRKRRSESTTLFATGGLYLALNSSHPNLGFHRLYGDFTSSYSHAFGVALAVMIMSEVFGIDYDKLVPIPVAGRRELDYKVRIPTGGWLYLEAKGVSSKGSLSGTRTSAYTKKLNSPKNRRSGKRIFNDPTAMISVITKVARPGDDESFIEIIDPPHDTDLEAQRHNNQVAGQYSHYAAAARFAGLYSVARMFDRLANFLTTGPFRLKPLVTPEIRVRPGASFKLFGQEIAGVQWPIGDGGSSGNAAWFYHGVNLDRIRHIHNLNEFPPSHPFSASESLIHSQENAVESLLPDGSYFGVGAGPREGLAVIDELETDLETLQIVEFDNSDLESWLS